MKEFVVIEKSRKIDSALFALAAFLIFGQLTGVFAHGGEDHGDSKPQTIVGEKGTVSRVARVGALEVMIKHALIEPNAATAARLFITDYQTNVPAGNVSPAAEIESASGGSIVEIKIEKNGSPGSFNLEMPALAAGIYTLRAKVTYAGETDTTTFTGIKVENAPTETGENNGLAGGSGLIILSVLIIFGLFGCLIYYGIRATKSGKSREEAVSV